MGISYRDLVLILMRTRAKNYALEQRIESYHRVASKRVSKKVLYLLMVASLIIGTIIGRLL